MRSSGAAAGGVNGTMEGSMFGYSIDVAGSADLSFHNGTIVSVGPAPANIRGKTVSFTGTGADNPPTVGVTLAPRPYNQCLISEPTTYREVTP